MAFQEEPTCCCAASAPGKVILFGEHAVVYGKTAVAAAVSDLRIRAEAAVRRDARLVVYLSDLGTSYDTALPQLILAAARHYPMTNPTRAAGHKQERAKPVQPPPALTLWLSEQLLCGYEDESVRKAFMAIIFLVIGMIGDHSELKDKGVTITVGKGSLPIGAGLGSSAALSVACAAALYRLRQLYDEKVGGNRDEELKNSESGASPPPSPAAAAAMDRQQNGCSYKHLATSATLMSTDEVSQMGVVPPLEVAVQINEWAFAAEVLLHGNPSGLDNTVSCFGSAVQYRKAVAAAPPPTCGGHLASSHHQSQPNGEPLPPPSSLPSTTSSSLAGFSEVRNFPKLRVLLTNTMVPRETRLLVAAVAERLRRCPSTTQALLDGIGDISEAFLARLQEEASAEAGAAAASSSSPASPSSPALSNSLSSSSLAAFTGDLMRQTHQLLSELGVSHPKLDAVCQASEIHGRGRLATKLTGAGGGGCAITLLSMDQTGTEQSRARDAFPGERPRESDASVDLLVKAFEDEEGFQCYQTTLGGCGVLWHSTQ